MKKFYYKLLLVTLLFIANSCNLDNFDFGKLSDDVNISPEFVMPLASADITIWDIIESVNDENDTLLKVGDNDVIKIVYTEEGIYDYQVRDLLDLPQQKSFSSGNKVIGNISLDNVLVNKEVSLRDITDAVNGNIDNIIPLDGTVNVFPATSYVGPPPAVYAVPDITDFTSVKFAKGNVEITLQNNLPVPITMEGGLINRQTGLGFAAFSFINLGPGNTETITVSMVGKTITNQIDFRMTKFETASTGFPALINLNDKFKLSMNFKDVEISEGNVKTDLQVISGFSGSFDFTFEDGVKVFEAILKGGFLDITSSNNSQLTGTINLTFPQMKKNGNPVQVAIPFSGSPNTVGLSNAVINLASDINTPYNKVPYTYSITVNASSGYINYNSTNFLTLNVNLSNLDYKSIKGDFGNKNITIDNGSFNLDTEFFDKISGNFKLANPELQLILTNAIGVPAEVDADFIAQNKSGQTVSLNPVPFRLATPASLTSPAVNQTITFDKTNSNIVNFIALPPSESISYSGNIRFNPDGAVSSANPNFIDLDSSLKIDLGVELPFELQVKDLTFEDTVKIGSGDMDMIKSAELIVNAINEIPLDIDVQLFFIDTISGQQYSSSAKSKLLTAAQISTAGVITPVTSSNSIALDENELAGLKKANGIVFKGMISSPENGTKTAVIYSNSKLNMNVVIKSKIDL
ncbi:MAG: hypothetical protein A2W90_06985 [Bacteroidetes bacterium GWF2_42_66]|nr:MAG: hypothetical protein A2W92_01675 [Bacteroidetes bacterium GWA2_42_15]OFY02887.1 MAG: hypothetical protein A2W89_24390 [Bacteroidetes bacterium GWE2_42_39]OFY44542.1 MAG: hypothetical protein A2W90_06985 [Bacteroidetes bacterium GWF2_42_66]HBL74900.1 hypothetical protein [Prolixibacteraceae bacterium]HCR91748.1 hypothetical protein [Prolixibacteraceae bacterium]